MTRAWIPERIIFAVRHGPRNAPARQWLAAYTGQAVPDDTSWVALAFDALRGKRLPPQMDIDVVS